MTDLMFVRLREKNEWEGETWNFWLQLNGNENALATLSEVLESDPILSETFTLGLARPKSEADVDELVEVATEDYENGDGGYTYEHHKIVGTLVLPPEEQSAEDWAQDLNKGSIKDFFEDA